MIAIERKIFGARQQFRRKCQRTGFPTKIENYFGFYSTNIIFCCRAKREMTHTHDFVMYCIVIGLGIVYVLQFTRLYHFFKDLDSLVYELFVILACIYLVIYLGMVFWLIMYNVNDILKFMMASLARGIRKNSN